MIHRIRKAAWERSRKEYGVTFQEKDEKFYAIVLGPLHTQHSVVSAVNHFELSDEEMELLIELLNDLSVPLEKIYEFIFKEYIEK